MSGRNDGPNIGIIIESFGASTVPVRLFCLGDEPIEGGQVLVDHTRVACKNQREVIPLIDELKPVQVEGSELGFLL